jgi:hypothetical protein
MLVYERGKFTAFPDSGAIFYSGVCLFDEILTIETAERSKGSGTLVQYNKAGFTDVYETL